jgi:hypothetical protein
VSRDGFPVADLDTGLLHDPKIIALARLVRDPRATAVYVALYLALVFESWARGSRATLAEACPAWWLDDIDDVAAKLIVVGLIDDGRRLPEHAWRS